jgi:hypothetical protein
LGKVFPSVAQQSTTAPYATYELRGSERKKTLQGHDGNINAPYQLDVFHTSYSLLRDLMLLTIAEIKTWEQTNLGATGPYIQAVEIDDEFETFDDEVLLYQGTINFTICYTE